jgi:hypothetical protein
VSEGAGELIALLNRVILALCEEGVRVTLAPMYPNELVEVALIVEHVKIVGGRLALVPGYEYQKNHKDHKGI